MNQNINEEQNGIDEPFETEDNVKATYLNTHTTLKLEEQIKVFETKEKHVFKRYGLYLIVGCLAGYFLIVVLDSILVNFMNWKTTSLETSFMELLKFLISSLIGFVFSESIKNKNE